MNWYETTKFAKNWSSGDLIQNNLKDPNKESQMSWYNIVKLAFPGRAPIKLPPGRINAIKELVEEGNNFNDIVEVVDISAPTLKRIMIENKIPVPTLRPRIKINDKTKELIVWLNEYQNKNQNEISKYLASKSLPTKERINLSPAYIYNFLSKTRKGYKRKNIESFMPTRKQLNTIKKLYFAPPLPVTQSVDIKGKEVEIEIKDIKDVMELVPGIEKTGYGISYIAEQLKIPPMKLYEWFKNEGPKKGLINRTKKEQLNTSGHRARKSIEKKRRAEEIGGYIGKLLNANSRKSAIGMLVGWRSVLHERAEEEEGRPDLSAAMYNKHRPFIDEASFPEDFALAKSREIANKMLNNFREVLTRVPWFFDYFKEEHTRRLISKHQNLIKETVYPGEEVKKEKSRAELLLPHIPSAPSWGSWEEKQLQDEINKEEAKKRFEETEFYRKLEEEEAQNNRNQ